MKLVVAALMLMWVAGAQEDPSCLFKDKSTGMEFDLSPLTKYSGDYQVQNKVDQRTYVFNFCKWIFEPCSSWKKALASREGKQLGLIRDCDILTGPNNDQFETNLVTTKYKYYMDKPGPVLQLFQDSKVQCDDTQTFGITFNIICEEYASVLVNNDFIIADDRCRPQLIFKHKLACPLKQSGVVGFFRENDPVTKIKNFQEDWKSGLKVLAGFLIAFGTGLACTGRKFEREMGAASCGFFCFLLLSASLYEFCSLTNPFYFLCTLPFCLFVYKVSLHFKLLPYSTGVISALFLLALSNPRHLSVQYLLLLLGCLLSTVLFLAKESAFRWYSAILGATMVVQGLTLFLGSEYPSFVQMLGGGWQEQELWVALVVELVMVVWLAGIGSGMQADEIQDLKLEDEIQLTEIKA